MAPPSAPVKESREHEEQLQRMVVELRSEMSRLAAKSNADRAFAGKDFRLTEAAPDASPLPPSTATMSRLESHKSRLESHKSRLESHKSRLESQKSRLCQ
eukprot:gene11498-34215_t